MSYQVNEIFSTVQGEGFFTGVPATFIRLQGCTVGCPWCDTKYTWKKGGQRMEVDAIVDQVRFRHVVITGGEPTLWNLDELIEALRKVARIIQLETSGQNNFKGSLRPNWVTWSPKRNLNFRAAQSILDAVDEVKFVVDAELELTDAWDCLETIFENPAHQGLPSPHIVMMPEGCPPSDASMHKAMEYAQAMSELTARPVRVMDRLQYRLGVK